MRTLLVVSCDEEFGGVASVVGNLARYLQSMHHQVTCFNLGETAFLKTKTTKWGFPGYELRLSSTRSSRLFRAITFLISFPVTMFQLMRLIQKHRIQIVNIHYPSRMHASPLSFRLWFLSKKNLLGSRVLQPYLVVIGLLLSHPGSSVQDVSGTC